jgi:multiple sugar transport system ATP-binding protein
MRPANLFVAGFIGSPSMNFISGTVRDGAIHLRFASMALDDRLRQAVAQGGGPDEVVVGVRPEDLELAGSDAAADGLRFDVVVDTVESTGADLYVHARVEGGLADSKHLEDLVSDEDTAPSRAADGTPRLVARLAPSTGARAGARITLRTDTKHVYVFDAASGRALSGAAHEGTTAGRS